MKSVNDKYRAHGGRAGREDKPVATPPTIELAVECRDCGEEFSPSQRDYVAGRWRRCPSCRTETPGADTITPIPLHTGPLRRIGAHAGGPDEEGGEAA